MASGSSALDRSMADRAESNKVPTRNAPNSDQEPQRSRGSDDRPTPPPRDEMNRKTAPDRDSVAPSSPAPVANRITATESPTKKSCNGLLQQNLPKADICIAADFLFDHLVGTLLEKPRHIEPECFGGPEIYHQFELGRHFDR